MRSRISSKLIIASCVGYSDHTYYEFYVTSSRMFVLTEGDKIGQLWNSRVYKHVAVDMYATLFTLVGRNLVNNGVRGNK